MDSSKNQFRIELTPEQKEKVRNATGKDAEAVELSVEELRTRLADSKEKLFQMRFQSATAPLKNPHQISATRRVVSSASMTMLGAAATAP